MATISAIIVTYNSCECSESCLGALQSLLPDIETIVVDNASADATVAELRRVAPEATVLENHTNLGFGRAANLGAMHATGSHLLFLNPDVVVTAVDRKALDSILETSPFGLVAPVLEGDGDRRRIEASLLLGFLSHTVGVLRPRELRPRARNYDGRSAAWVSGAILLASREEFLDLGGFDPRFFLYYEDRELSLRYREVGLPIRPTEAVRGRHVGGGSSASDGLRVQPMAWSLLGWIEYLWMSDGERVAARAARAALGTLRVLRAATHLVALSRWRRAQRKAQQLDALLSTVSSLTAVDGLEFCPNALRLVSRAGL